MMANIDLVWVIFCAILVSVMQAGFCCLESGLVRSKNSINVAIKNLVDFCIASLIFSVFGFALMFGTSNAGLVGQLYISPDTWGTQEYTFFLFELVFCGTAATIVSGAVAERMSFIGYFITTVILSLAIYPITGHWAWGGLQSGIPTGWLEKLGFHDFAGSTVVHSVGAWTALAAILIIGPRIGRFTPHPKAIEGHNLPTAILGVFLLWFGWFGFNGGSTLMFSEQVPQILVNTAQGGAAGGFSALLTTWLIDKRPQVPLIMNGVIGGLVSVTAGCDAMLPQYALFTGLMGGILCTLSTRFLNYHRIDDAVGVIPAHLFCGIWGTIAVAFFGDLAQWSTYNLWQRLAIQGLGVMVIGLYAFGLSYMLLTTVGRFIPLRVSATQERIGLNISEHGTITATQRLLASVNNLGFKPDLSQQLKIEPDTDVALIADHYNQVLEKMTKIQNTLQMGHSQLLQILHSPAFPVVISHLTDGKIHFVNQRAAELFGFPIDKADQYSEVNIWADLSDRTTFFIQLEEQGRIDNFEAQLQTVDRKKLWTLVSGVQIIYGQEPCVIFSFSDISTQVSREMELRRIATLDSLTGVYNRRYFLELAEAAIMEDIELSRPTALLMIDIDHFKRINDTFGHHIGDEVIQNVTKICQGILRENDILGRLGGEEFAIVLVNTSLVGAKAVAERLRQAVAQAVLFESPSQYAVTISVGITALQEIDTITQALQRADIALYRAKHNGRNLVEIDL